jgi:DNA modification methylase
MGNNVKLTWHTEKRRLGDLIEWDKNPRQLKEHDAEHLKKSLDNFGVADPLIINTDNRIIGGHMRRRIMLQSGYKPDDLVDVRVPERELTEREAEELAIRLNKNTGDWDFDALANNFELDDLLNWGFDKKELDIDLWADEPPEGVEPQIDKAEELREKWGVESGQLWKLGEHRLICGDCTDKAVVDRVMGGEKADMVFTDPPYNIGYDYWDYFDSKEATEYKNWCSCWFSHLASISPLIIMTIGQWNMKMWFDIEKPLGIAIWLARNKTSGSKISMFSVWEPILFYGKKINKKKAKFDYLETFGLPNDYQLVIDVNEAIKFIKDNDDVFEINNIRQKGVEGHSCPKQLSLIEEIINNYSDKENRVLDTFLGSGTTLIACERLGRKCRAVEISPAYCAVAIQRWVDVTNGTPELVN